MIRHLAIDVFFCGEFMNKITREMIKIYKPLSGMDWLNYKIVNKEDITFHHIQKRCDGGKRIITNGALLLPTAHRYIHLIEIKDIDTYIAINKIFKYINEQQHEPTMEQREILEYLLRQFESEHRWDKGSKGKLLIKREYYQRAL